MSTTLTQTVTEPTKVAPKSGVVKSGVKRRRTARWIHVSGNLLKPRAELIYRAKNKDDKKTVKTEQLLFYQNLSMPPSPLKSTMNVWVKNAIEANEWSKMMGGKKIRVAATSGIKMIMGLDEFIGSILRGAQIISACGGALRKRVKVHHLHASFKMFQQRNSRTFTSKTLEEIEDMFTQLSPRNVSSQTLANVMDKYKRGKKKLYLGDGLIGTLRRHGIWSCTRACKCVVEILADMFLQSLVDFSCTALISDKKKIQTIQDGHVVDGLKYLNNTILLG